MQALGSQSIATRSQSESATRSANMRKHSTPSRYHLARRTRQNGFPREHPIMAAASTSLYAVVHVRCAILPKKSGGDKTRPGQPAMAFQRHPLSITQRQGCVNPSCHIFSRQVYKYRGAKRARHSANAPKRRGEVGRPRKSGQSQPAVSPDAVRMQFGCSSVGSSQSMKRKRISAHMAAKPSRQVIFLPSA